MTDQPDLQDRHELEQADVEATARLAENRHHPVVRALGKLSEIADQPPLFTLSALVLAYGLVRRSGREVEAGLRMLAAEAIATWLKGLIKDRYARTRPHRLLDEGEYRSEPGDPEDGDEQSFPSGHTAGAVAVAGVLAPVYPAAAIPLLGAAAAVSALQPLRAKHYVADVLAGMAIGAASAATVHLAARGVRRWLAR